MDFKENSQFIIISHSKRTMSMADVPCVADAALGVSKDQRAIRVNQPTDAAVA